MEGRIPWSDFLRTGGRPDAGETWRFALGGDAPPNSLPVPDRHRGDDYADLRFVGPDAKRLLRARGVAGYTPITTSRVIGSPEPPPPYRARRVLPKLKLTYPIDVICEPGSRRLWLIDQSWPYGPARMARTEGDPESGEPETLLRFENAVGYDIAFHPDFARNGYVYVGSNGGPTGTKKTRVTRYTVEREPPYRLDIDSGQVIIEWRRIKKFGRGPSFFHNLMLNGVATPKMLVDVDGGDRSRG